MVAAGTARKLVFGWIGNPGVGSLHGIRRAIEKEIPHPLEVEEYSHFGLLSRLKAGASGLPFMPIRAYHGTDLPVVNDNIRQVECPFTGETLYAVPALHPDVAIVHAQRADASGNTQVWGLLGVQKEVAFAAKRCIVVVEEIVDESVIRRDPNRTLIPGRRRRRGRPRALRRPPELRPGLLRPGQRLLRRLGRPVAHRGRPSPATSTSGSTASKIAPDT